MGTPGAPILTFLAYSLSREQEPLTEFGNSMAGVEAPFYLPLADEIEVFKAAYQAKLPVLLKGPTGCGKTRFVEHMNWLLNDEEKRSGEKDLITVSCHEDLTATDMVGRYLLKGCLLYTSPSPRDLSTSRMPSSA